MSAHNVLFEMFSEACPYCPKDPGASGQLIADRQFCLFEITTAGAEARTLDQPDSAGKLCAVVLDARGGDLTLTVTGGYNSSGSTSLTFGDAGDFVMFYSIEVGTSFYWRPIGADGVDVLTPLLRATSLFATALSVTGNQTLGGNLDIEGFVQNRVSTFAATTTATVPLTTEIAFLTGNANGRTYSLPAVSVGPRVAAINKTTATFIIVCNTTGVSVEGATSLAMATSGAASGQYEFYNDGTNWYALAGG